MSQPRDADLAPDLEWMLSSGQAPRAVLASALAAEFGPALLQLAAAHMGDPQSAGEAARAALSAALLNDYRFSGHTGVDAWFWNQALPVLRLTRRKKPSRKSSLAALFPPEPSGFPSGSRLLLALVSGLQPDSRLAVLLNCLLGWSPERIAPSLDCPPETAAHILKSAWATLTAEEFAFLSHRDLSAADLPTRLAAAIHQRYPRQDFSEEVVERLAAAAVQSAGRLGLRRSRFSASLEFALIGAAVLVVASFIWGYNRVSPEPTATPTPPPPTSTPVPRIYEYYYQKGESLPTIAARVGVPVDQIIAKNYSLSRSTDLPPDESLKIPYLPATPAPPEPDNGEQPRPSPLSASSSPEKIRATLSRSGQLWKTLWADASLVYYGPVGYIGPPTFYRSQVWALAPGDMHILYAYDAASQPSAEITLGDVIYTVGEGGYSQIIGPEPDRGLVPIKDLIIPTAGAWYSPTLNLQPVREEFFAGRRAVVVDWDTGAPAPASLQYLTGNQRRGQAWIDAYTGVILKLRFFSDVDPAVVLYDVVLNKVYFDVAFPQEHLFDPFYLKREHFVEDYRGQPVPTNQPWPTPDWQNQPGRQPKPAKTPPPGFDPSRSRLAFQALGSSPWNESGPVDIFADDYLLGRLNLPPLWNNSLCDRTPDGRKLLYLAWKNEASTLQIMDLTDVTHVITPSRVTNVYNLVISPDGSQAAVIAALPGAQLKLSLFDLRTYEFTPLQPLDWAWSLIWSPDGKSLALITPKNSSEDLEARVLDLSSNEWTHRADVSWQDLQGPRRLSPTWPSPDFPTHAWGVPFPAPANSLEACVFPPK